MAKAVEQRQGQLPPAPRADGVFLVGGLLDRVNGKKRAEMRQARAIKAELLAEEEALAEKAAGLEPVNVRGLGLQAYLDPELGRQFPDARAAQESKFRFGRKPARPVEVPAEGPLQQPYRFDTPERRLRKEVQAARATSSGGNSSARLVTPDRYGEFGAHRSAMRVPDWNLAIQPGDVQADDIIEQARVQSAEGFKAARVVASGSIVKQSLERVVGTLKSRNKRSGRTRAR